MEAKTLKASEGRGGYPKTDLVRWAVEHNLSAEPAAKRMTKAELVKLLLTKTKSKTNATKTKATKTKATKTKVTKKKAVLPSSESSEEVIFSPPHPPSSPGKKVPIPAGQEAVVDEAVRESKIKLLPHQVRVVRHLQTHPGVIAHWEPGAGKTLLAATAAAAYLKTKPKGKIVVLLPKTLEGNFRKGLRDYGFSKKVIDSKFSFYGFLEYYNRLMDDEVPTSSFMLIIDEAQNLRKVPKSGRTGKQSGKGSKGAVEASKMADKVLILTGGAYYNSPYDLEMMMALVKKRDPISKKLFLEKTETVALTKKYARCAIDFYWGQKKDYPEVSQKVVHVKMDKKMYRTYMEKDAEYRSSSKGDMGEDKQPMWISNMRAKLNTLFSCPKCDAVMNYIRRGKRCLVYSFFKKTGIDLLKAKCDAEGITYLEITGSTPKEKKRSGAKTVQEIVSDYNSGKVQVLFITKAGLEGLDLKGTFYVLILEANFNPSTDTQLIARAVRYRSLFGYDHQVVKVRFFSLSKPDNAKALEEAAAKALGRDDFEFQPSIDDYLLSLVARKGEMQKETYEKFQAASIENGGCTHPQGTDWGEAEWSKVSPSKPKKSPEKATAKKAKAAKAKKTIKPKAKATKAKATKAKATKAKAKPKAKPKPKKTIKPKK